MGTFWPIRTVYKVTFSLILFSSTFFNLWFLYGRHVGYLVQLMLLV